MEEDPEHMSREQGEGMMLGTGAGRIPETERNWGWVLAAR